MNLGVYNHKGGCGKSTISAHLGFYAQQNNYDVTMVDIDRQRNLMSWLSNHTWTGDSAYNMGSVTVTFDDLKYDSSFVIYDCPPSFDIIDNMKNSIDKWLIPVDGRFSVEGALAVVDEIRRTKNNGDIFIVVNKSLSNGFGRKERDEINKLGLKVFYLEIPLSDVVRKSESYGQPLWNIPYASRSLATQNMKLLCKWVFDGFTSKNLL